MFTLEYSTNFCYLFVHVTNIILSRHTFCFITFYLSLVLVHFDSLFYYFQGYVYVHYTQYFFNSLFAFKFNRSCTYFNFYGVCCNAYYYFSLKRIKLCPVLDVILYIGLHYWVHFIQLSFEFFDFYFLIGDVFLRLIKRTLIMAIGLRDIYFNLQVMKL